MRLVTSGVLRKGIARGVSDRTFGCAANVVAQLGADGRRQVPAAKVRVGAQIAEDGTDLESRFVTMPQAVPQAAPAVLRGPVPTDLGPGPIPPGPVLTGPTPPGATPPAAAGHKTVPTFSANRDQLFTVWNAVANLADLALKVQLPLRAGSESGFERRTLQEGVIEPSWEADLM